MVETVGLSVVVCTYDRYEALQQALSMLLEHSDFRDTSCELVVVENTPIERRETIEIPDLPNARVVICDEVGLSAARNCGISSTTGAIVAFLDDDALVGSEWCSKLLAAFEDPDVLAVGGKVIPEYPFDKMPAWYNDKLAEYLSCLDWGPRARRLNPGEWIVGANCAFRRSVFEAFGLFSTDLGRKGAASLLSNEEIALIHKIGEQRILYSPEVLARHLIPIKRLTPKWFRSRVYWQAVSDMVAGTTHVSAAEARKEYGELISRFEADRRNLNALFFTPENYGQFALQLRAVYLAALVFGEGGI